MNKIESRSYKIASKNFTINYGSGSASKILQKELSLYEETSGKADIIIDINGELGKKEALSKNPGIHEEIENGFRCNFGPAEVTWFQSKEALHVNLALDENKKSLIQKFYGIQYTHPYEDIGRVFHELVLIPTLFFFPADLTLIHGSALETNDNNAIIVGGAGGVGKTSLELFLTLKNNFKFLADDITIVDKNKFIWPNYAFPKIYEYNTRNKKEIEKKVLQKRGLLDKLQWMFTKKLTHRSIRRRINPEVFYNGAISKGGKLSDYFILFRGNYNDFEIKPISVEKAVETSLEIIKTEYDVFFKQLHWHKYNRYLLGSKTIIDANNIIMKWQILQKNILNNCRCYKVKIPLRDDITKLEKQFSSFLKK